MTEQTLEHFRDHGWMRVPRALAAEAAQAMRNAAWRALEAAGIHRDRPSTWVERPAHLQRLKDEPAFHAAASRDLHAAIDAILGAEDPERQIDWGAVFVAMPSRAQWTVPSRGWHIDAKYTSPLWPATGVKTFALFGDVEPRGGGTLLVAGSHRLLHRWFDASPPPPDARSAEMRRRLMAHPYIRDLHGGGSADERVSRFMGGIEEIDGIPLRVVETTGAAGDVYLVHPLVMHVAAPNNASGPRFLLSGGITTDMWGWG